MNHGALLTTSQPAKNSRRYAKHLSHQSTKPNHKRYFNSIQIALDMRNSTAPRSWCQENNQKRRDQREAAVDAYPDHQRLPQTPLRFALSYFPFASNFLKALFNLSLPPIETKLIFLCLFFSNWLCTFYP